MLKRLLQRWLEISPRKVQPHPNFLTCPVCKGKRARQGSNGQPGWFGPCAWYVVDGSPDQWNPFVVGNNNLPYFNAVTPPGLGPPPGTWTTCNVSSYIPLGACAIDARGILIITHGTTQETADVILTFRKDATIDYGPNYPCQCICAFVGDGQRSGSSVIVPLTAQGTFDWRWDAIAYPSGVIPTYAYPSYSAYGCNLRIQQYAVPLKLALQQLGVQVP